MGNLPKVFYERQSCVVVRSETKAIFVDNNSFKIALNFLLTKTSEEPHVVYFDLDGLFTGCTKSVF